MVRDSQIRSDRSEVVSPGWRAVKGLPGRRRAVREGGIGRDESHLHAFLGERAQRERRLERREPTADDHDVGWSRGTGDSGHGTSTLLRSTDPQPVTGSGQPSARTCCHRSSHSFIASLRSPLCPRDILPIISAIIPAHGRYLSILTRTV
jgi:hypothetical protein